MTQRAAKERIRQTSVYHEVAFSNAIGGEQPDGGLEDISWMWDVYRSFRRAFLLGSDGGLVRFE